MLSIERGICWIYILSRWARAGLAGENLANLILMYLLMGFGAMNLYHLVEIAGKQD